MDENKFKTQNYRQCMQVFQNADSNEKLDFSKARKVRTGQKMKESQKLQENATKRQENVRKGRKIRENALKQNNMKGHLSQNFSHNSGLRPLPTINLNTQTGECFGPD